MARPLDHVEREAMKLPPQERAALAEHLLATLDEGEDLDAEQAWVAEAEQRYQAYRAGRMGAVTADRAFAEARRRIAERDAR